MNNKARRQTVATSFLLCFGGGVLLSTAMLHILPETIETLSGPGQQMNIEFLPQLVLCSGFFLIYIVEELVDLILGSLHHSESIHKSLSMRKSKNVICDETESKNVTTALYFAHNHTIHLSESRTTIVSTKTRVGCCEDNNEECHNDLEINENINSDEVYIDSIYNPKYEVKLSQSTNAMFPNYQSPDSLIVIETQAQTQQQLQQLKRKNSVKSIKSMKAFENGESMTDGKENKQKKRTVALRDFFTGL